MSELPSHYSFTLSNPLCITGCMACVATGLSNQFLCPVPGANIIATGAYTTWVTMADGSVMCSGWSAYGMLGFQPSTIGPNIIPGLKGFLSL